MGFERRLRCGVWGVAALLAVNSAAWAQKEDRLLIEPSFNADATAIVWVERVTKDKEPLASEYELWTIGTDGTGARRLTDGNKDEQPRFSPDGTYVVFKRDKDIWRVNRDGSGLRNLTNTPNATEELPEFTNDGRSLLFIRKEAEKLTPEAEKTLTEQIAIDPLIAWGVGIEEPSVVLRDLENGTERVLLGPEYAAKQVVPNPTDDNAVFVLCVPLDNDGKPRNLLLPDSIVAVVKLDGGPTRAVFHIEPETKLSLKKMRIAARRNIFEVNSAVCIGTQVAVLEDGKMRIVPEMTFFGDVSPDGNTLLGVGIIDDKPTSGLKLYDIPSKKSGGLARFASVLAAPAEVAPAGAAPQNPTTLIALANAPQPEPATAPAVTAPPATTDPAAIPARAEELFAQGEALALDDKTEEAIAAFGEAIKLHPTYAEAYYQRGWSHYINDDTPAALRDIHEAIRIEPKNPRFYSFRATLYVATERLAEAVAELTTAIQLDPKDSDFHYERANVRLKQKEPIKALADFDKAIALEPKRPVLYYARADALIITGKHEAAVKDLTEGIRLLPKWPGAYEMRAKAYRALKKPDLAAADEKKAAELKAQR
jgi:Tfp pilus assembly protein PilF